MLQILLNGLITGMNIALLAVAFQIVYLPTRVFFVGLAGLFALAPYVFLAAQNAGLLWPACLLVAVVLTAAFAALNETLNHGPLSRKGASEGAHLVSSLGIYVVLVQLIVIFWGSGSRTLRTGIDPTLQFADLVLTKSQLIAALTSGFLIFSFLALLWRSRLGLRLRALADNPMQFSQLGYSHETHRLIAFVGSGFLTAFSSILIASEIAFDPYSGLHYLLLAVVAVIVGGRHSFVGPIVAGLALGLLRAEISWLFSARWQEPATFAILIAAVLLRPDGLLSGLSREKDATA